MNTASGSAKEGSVSTKIFTQKLTEDDIAELAKKIHKDYMSGAKTFEDSAVKSITEWQAPEKDVLEGPWHTGSGIVSDRVYNDAGSLRIARCDDPDMDCPTQDRIARAIVEIPQMVKFIRNDVEEFPQNSGVTNGGRAILDAIDNITPAKE